MDRESLERQEQRQIQRKTEIEQLERKKINQEIMTSRLYLFPDRRGVDLTHIRSPIAGLHLAQGQCPRVLHQERVEKGGR